MIDARQHSQQGALARAITAYQSYTVPLFQRQIQIVQRSYHHNPIVVFGNTVASSQPGKSVLQGTSARFKYWQVHANVL